MIKLTMPAMAAGILLSGGVIPVCGQVVLNEILADNRITVSEADEYPDYVELHNPSAQTLNLGGLGLTDDIAAPGKFIFPPNTLLAPFGYLMVWCDGRTNLPGLHTSFALNDKGETVALHAADRITLLDAVTFGLQLPDQSIGRIPDGSGGWALNLPTPALPNRAQPLAEPRGLRINEWMANAVPNDDWLELYNSSNAPVAIGGLVFTDRTSGAPTNRPIPALSFVGADDFIQFIADDLDSPAADHLDLKLSSTSGETITLYDVGGAVILDQVTFGPQTLNISQGRLPDGGDTLVFFATNKPSPDASNFLLVTNLVFNEILAHADPPLEDAIELYNPTTQDVDISYWYLTSNPNSTNRYRLPAGTIVSAGGYKVFYEYQFNPGGTGFALKSYEADEVFLFSADVSGVLTGYRLRRSFDASANGRSMGRVQTSDGWDFTVLSGRSFGMDTPATLEQFRTGTGLTNPGPRLAPVVINEIMYHPPDILIGGLPADNSLDEFIELANRTAAPVPLYDPAYPTNTWHLRGGVDFDLPQGVTLAPQSYLLLVNFNPGDAGQLSQFFSRYNVPPGVPVFGPYSGKLDNRGETVELKEPDPPQPPGRPRPGFVPYLPADKVKYSDRAPWASTPDTGVHSLQRLNPSFYANDPAHWGGALPTPGRPNSAGLPRFISWAKAEGGPLTLRFTALAGLSYAVEFRENLTSGNWLGVTNLPPQTASGEIEVTDPAAGFSSMRFYRVTASAP